MRKTDEIFKQFVLLLTPSPQAIDILKDGGLQFRFTLLKLYEMPSADFLQHADLHLLPFLSIMQGGEQANCRNGNFCRLEGSTTPKLSCNSVQVLRLVEKRFIGEKILRNSHSEHNIDM